MLAGSSPSCAGAAARPRGQPRPPKLALGYRDCKRSSRLRDNPACKILFGRDTDSGQPLAPHPTLSRLEGSLSDDAPDRNEDTFPHAPLAHRQDELWPEDHPSPRDERAALSRSRFRSQEGEVCMERPERRKSAGIKNRVQPRAPQGDLPTALPCL